MWYDERQGKNLVQQVASSLEVVEVRQSASFLGFQQASLDKVIPTNRARLLQNLSSERKKRERQGEKTKRKNR
jgi:hypothetical protein